jgi:hypothetical protein
LPKKVHTILDLEPPTNLKELRRALGIIQYYQDIWQQRNHILSHLTVLVRKGKKKTKWERIHQESFKTMKQIVSKDVLLAYLDFNLPFKIHTDASDRQLGAVIAQKGELLAFYRCKLNTAQRNYTTSERELLSIVETVKEFKNILLGFPITVYTDHKNLMHDTVLLSSERAMQWQLLIEEFSPEIKYVKGIKNVVADALSRLHTNTGNLVQDPVQNSPEALEKILGVKLAMELNLTFFPLDARIIDQEQRKVKELLRNVGNKNKENFKVSKVDGHYLITDDGKIVILSTYVST